MRLEFQVILQFDQSLLHRLATPTKHRFRAPGTSPADFYRDLRLKRSSVCAAQSAAKLLDDILTVLEKFPPHETPPCLEVILGFLLSLTKVNWRVTDRKPLLPATRRLIDQRLSCGRRLRPLD